MGVWIAWGAWLGCASGAGVPGTVAEADADVSGPDGPDGDEVSEAPPPAPSSPVGCVVERRLDNLPADGVVDRICTETWGADEAHPVARDCADAGGAWSEETFAYDEGGCLEGAALRRSSSAPDVAWDQVTTEATCDDRHQPTRVTYVYGSVYADGTEQAATETHEYDNDYDDEGRIVERREADGADRSGARVWTWTWDAGLLVEEAFDGPGEGWILELRYDAEARLVETVQTWVPGGTPVAERTARYDVYGRPVGAWHDVPGDGDGPEVVEGWRYAEGMPGAVELWSETVGDPARPLTWEGRTYDCPEG